MVQIKVVVTCTTGLTVTQIKAHEIHRGKEDVVRLLLAVASSTIQVAVRFSFVPSQFNGRTPLGWSETSYLSSPSTNLTRGLAAQRLFRAEVTSSLLGEPTPFLVLITLVGDNCAILVTLLLNTTYGNANYF
ncbi:hypothetical protein TNCV_1752731 [Trichonephila clavipes]|nr:hypothetical protein TNCV_1752731 [Trichonephila clavipes]